MQRNVLHIGTTGTDTPFLAENELPDSFRLTGTPEDELKAMADTAKLMEDQDLRKALDESSRAAGAASSSTASASTSAATASAATTILPTDNFTEEMVREIIALGFARDKIIAELRAAKGNKTQAVAALFAKSLTF